MDNKLVTAVVQPFRWPLHLLFIFAIAAVALPLNAGDPNQKRGFAADQVFQVGDVDSVNISNGNLVLRVPLGQQYESGPRLRYQLVLIYNSKIWDYENYEYSAAAPNLRRYTVPERHSNTGFGWILSLGRLEPIPKDTNSVANPTYIAADGSTYEFSGGTHAPLTYSTGGAYMRMRVVDGGDFREIDFPDGTVHRFHAASGSLREMRDADGHWVRFNDYSDPNIWTISDGYLATAARTHLIHVEPVTGAYDHPTFARRIKGVDLQVLGGRPAEYRFRYDETLPVVARDMDTGRAECIKAPLLRRIELPDGSYYEADYKTVTTEPCQYRTDLNGAIRSLRLPTGGSISWGEGYYDMNMPSCTASELGFEAPYVGITSRVTKDAAGKPIAEWLYHPRLRRPGGTSSLSCGGTEPLTIPTPAAEFVNVVKGPNGLVTRHFFSAWPANAPPHPAGPNGPEHGLPFTRLVKSPVNARPLSKEIIDCPEPCLVDDRGNLTGPDGAPKGTVLRREYVHYRKETFFDTNGDVPLTPGAQLRQMYAQQVEHTTDLGCQGKPCYSDSQYDDFDHYGHYRSSVSTSNVPGSPSRQTFTNYQPAVAGNKWLLGLYDYSWVKEGGEATKKQATFDTRTGAMISLRTFASRNADPDAIAPGDKDLLTTWCRDTATRAGQRGYVTSERYVGGDQSGIPADVCAAAVPAPGHYFVDHSYTFDRSQRLIGRESVYAGTTHQTADVELDPFTGLTTVSRDNAGVETLYEYDSSGRLVKVTSPAQAPIVYTYDLVATPPSVRVERWKPGSTSGDPSSLLKDDHYYYDGLGRLLLTKSRMPDVNGASVWATVQTTYDKAGRVASVSGPVASSSPAFQSSVDGATTKKEYDLFNRSTRETAPDGSTVTFQYEGMRAQTRTQTIWDGQADRLSRTREEYDAFGRLVKVVEPSGTSVDGAATDVLTEYRYGVGDHLTRVTINGTQPRTFEYDGRGLLKSETLPEAGARSYSYDARGHVIAKTELDPWFDLAFAYDRAERATAVSGRGPGGDVLPLKQFTYVEQDAPGERGKGKLRTATRFNYPVDPGPSRILDARQDLITVTETYSYPEEGRRTLRQTEIKSHGNEEKVLANFVQSVHYNELDLPDAVTYPTCERCTQPLAGTRDTVRTVYDRGYVSAVENVIERIDYHVSGLWASRRRVGTGVVDQQLQDPTGIARPHEIKVSVPPACRVIDQQPETALIAAGEAARFTVTSAASDARYQWYVGARGDTRRAIAGATSNVLTIASVTATTSYWCRVTTSTCPAGARYEDSVAVLADVCRLIASHPAANVTVARGESASVSVTAIPADATFQWFTGVSGDTSKPVAGATANTLTVASVSTTASYWCRVRSGTCEENSRTTVVTMCDPVAIVRPAVDASPSLAIKGVASTYQVEATGSPLSYAWYAERAGSKVYLGAGMQIDYAPTEVTTEADPLVIAVDVSNGCVAQRRVVARLVVTGELPPCVADLLTAPGEMYQTIAPNQATTMYAKARLAMRRPSDPDYEPSPAGSPQYTNIRYRFDWYKEGVLAQSLILEGERPEAQAGQPVPVESDETAHSEYLLRFATTQTYTRLDVSLMCTAGTQTVNSPVVSVRSFAFQYGHCAVPAVAAVPSYVVLQTAPDAQGIPNVQPATLKAESVYTRATFQWYQGESGNTRTPAWQGQTDTLVVTEPGTYWVRAFSECGGQADSATVTVSKLASGGDACAPVRIVRDPSSVAIAAFQALTLEVEATADPAHPPTSYLWSAAPDQNVPNGRNAKLVLPAGPRKTTDYSVAVANDCSRVRSRFARVHVKSCADVTIHAQPQNGSIAAGATLELEIAATATAPLRYQWYYGDSGDTSRPIGGLAPGDPAYDESKHGRILRLVPTGTERYWVRLSFDDATKCEVDSDTATVNVCGAPTINNAPKDSNSGFAGQDQTFTVAASGENLSYAWYEGTQTSYPTGKPLSTTPALLVYPQKTTSYWVTVTSDCAPPSSDQSASAAFKVSVCPDFTGTEIPTAATTLVSHGATTTLSVAVNGADAIEWYSVVGTGTPVKFAEGGPELFTVTTPPITQKTSFFAKATSGKCSVSSDSVAIDACSSPVVRWTSGIPEQVAKGSAVTLTAALAVGETASWAWYRGPKSGDVGGSTLIHQGSNRVDVQSLQATTSFWVRATDPANGCYSDSTLWTVNVCVPTIVTEPQSVSVAPNTSATLTIVTDNLAGVTYQWYQGQPGDVSTPLDSRSASLTVTPSATTTYWVRLTGCPAPLKPVTRDSQAATVTVCQPPKIDAQPQAKSYARNVAASISVAASGNALRYQWYEGAAGDVTKPVGTDSATFTWTTTVSKRFWVRVTGSCGSVDSTVALQSVHPEITAHPASASVTKDSTHTLTVAANGTELQYEWYQRSGTTTTKIEGATSSSYTTPPIKAEVRYFSRVHSGLARTDSQDAVLTLCVPSTFTVSQRSDVSGAEANLSVDAPAAGETFQWFRGASGVTSDPVGSGPRIAVYPTASTQYWVRTTRASCSGDSTARTVEVCRPHVTGQPASVTITAGTSASLTVTATGTPQLSYQWYRGSHGDTTSPVAGGTSSTLVTGPLQATTWFWARVTSGAPASCASRTSDSTIAVVTVCQPPKITTQPLAKIHQRNATASIAVAATGDGLHYQWYEGAAGDATRPVGTDSSTYSWTTTVSKSFWVRVTGSCGTNADSVAALQSVAPEITTHPASASVTKNTAVTLTVASNGTELRYEWYQRTATGITLLNETRSSFTTPPIAGETRYFSRVYSALASTDSQDAVLTLCLPSTFSVSQRSDVSTAEVNLSVDAPAAGETFQWFRGASGVTSDPVASGARVAVYPAASTQYWVRTTRASCHADSAARTVEVCRPNITGEPASATIAAGASATLTVSATGTPALSYQWYRGSHGDTTAPVAGGTSATLVTGPLHATTWFWARVTSGASASCASRTSDSTIAVVTVCEPPVITSGEIWRQASWNETVALQVSATGDGLRYQWYEGSVGDTSKPVGTDSNTHTFTAQRTTNFWVRVSGSCGAPAISKPIGLSVYPVIQTQPVDTMICGAGGVAQFSVVASTGVDKYQWYRKVSGQAAEPVGANSPSLEIPVPTMPVEFWVVLTSGRATTTSQRATVTGTNPVPTIVSFTATAFTSIPGQYQLKATVASSDAGLVGYTFYEGPLGDTSKVIPGTATSTTRNVTPATRPAKYWVKVHYNNTGCSASRELTIQ